MMESFIPPFDFHMVFVEPWTELFVSYRVIFLMGFLVCATCGLVGNFIILRRMALIGDAISHSLLPGIAVAFIITGSRDTFLMMLGAVAAGILTSLCIEFIHKKSRLKTDAAIGIVFSTFFAVGVILITLFADRVDLDADCVLYGEINYIAFEEPLMLGGIDLGPLPLVRMAIVSLVVIAVIRLFYKELVVTSFDPGLATSLGVRTNWFHFGLMAALSIVIVSSFESVGLILVIAMLIFPGATASLLSDRLPTILVITVGLALVYALTGVHLAVWLNCSIAGAMTVAAGFFFILAWVFSPRKGLLRRWLVPLSTKDDYVAQTEFTDA